MTELTKEELRRENEELRQRLNQLRKPANGALGTVAGLNGVEAISRMVEALPTAEIAGVLRDLSLRCVRLSRESTTPRVGRLLEEISVDLAQCAASIEAVVNNTGAAS